MITLMNDSTPIVVDGAWLQSRLDDPNIRIIDATTHLKHATGDGYYTLSSGRETFDQEHIPGAVFADLLSDFADQNSPFPMTVPPSEQFARKVGELGIGNEHHVIIYDQLDVAKGPEFYQFWASRLWWHFRVEGFTRVSVLDGGLGKWKAEGRLVSDAVTSHPPASFTAQRQPHLLALIDDVGAAIDNDNKVLINVLDDATFSGEKKTYERAGHIPSSQHVFFGLLINPETGRYREPEEVRDLFAKAGALDPDKQTITYCGGGIAATVAALQLARLGRDDVAVYDGSMTEWAKDPSRPLQLGAAK